MSTDSRPLPLQILPFPMRTTVYMRLFAKRHAHWPALFARAPLAFAPSVAMRDLVPGDVISGHIAFTGAYETRLSREIAQRARQGGLFVDVGANMGYFSLLWAAARPDNRVVAFEASPAVAARLAANVITNGLESRIEILREAASDRAGTLRFDVGPADQTGWGGITADAVDGIEVTATRLDDVLGDARVDVLKIDVEGAETLVLRGAEALLRARRVGTIFFEDNVERMAQLGVAPGAAQALLQSCGYRCTAFNAEQTEWRAELVQ